MVDNAFELIDQQLDKALTEQGFVRQNVSNKEDKDKVALYLNESVAYSMLYETNKKRFELRTCGMTDDGPNNEWKNIATWLFDPDNDTLKEAESIAADFVETVCGTQRRAIAQAAAKKRKKDEDGNVDPLFLMNRLVNVFPELREEIRDEREHYERFRGVTFAREKVVPKLQLLLRSGNEKQLDKLMEILSDVYNMGDLDARGLITVVILNSIEGDDIAKVEQKLTPELQKAWKAARHYKGKKIKPEKKKKEKKFVSDTLNSKGFGR